MHISIINFLYSQTDILDDGVKNIGDSIALKSNLEILSINLTKY